MKYTNNMKINYGIALFGFNWLSDKAIDESFDILSDKEKDILTKRFKGNMCLEEIGDTLGITRERVRQIETKALRKIRCFFADKGNEIFDISCIKQNQNRSRRG